MAVLLGLFLLCLVISLPIAFAMLISTYGAITAGGFDPIVVAQRLLGGMDSVPLLAVPGFILAGEIMTKGGLATRLIILIDTMIGHLRNGLSIATIGAGMFFSAMNGVAAATTAAIGELMIPQMEKKGYDKDYVAALSAVIGPLGPIIPPSVIMIIYAVGANLSVGDLFLAGIIPGACLGIALMLFSFWMTRKMPLEVLERATFKDFLNAFGHAIWSLLTPIIILGGIYGGVFTPSEAAVVAIFYSLFVGIVIHKELDWPIIKKCLINTLETGSMIMLIIGAASAFGWMVTVTNVSGIIAGAILSITKNPIIIMLLVNLALVLIGCFMDTISAIIVFQTVFIPIAAGIGMDMLHFACIFIVVIAIGNATPPFGYSLFVAAKISDSPLETISARVLPMIGVMFVVAVLLNIFPWMATLIPYSMR
jgi:C4-dicarboxylate transporter DctM subunit